MNKMFEMCKNAWNEACSQGYISENSSKEEIEENAYEILQFSFDDVDGLSDEEFDECVNMLISFLN